MKTDPYEIGRLATEMRDKLGYSAGHIARAQSDAAFLAGEFERHHHWRSVATAIAEIESTLRTSI